MSEITVYEPQTSPAKNINCIEISAAVKTSQDLMFEPTDSNEVDIFNTTGDNGVQSRDLQETEAEPELQCVEDTYSMPVEHKCTAFLLDSCEEAIALDAALVALDGVNMHSSEPPKGIILSIENEPHMFFKTKFKMQMFNCSVL